jgi:hypothetical protein
LHLAALVLDAGQRLLHLEIQATNTIRDPDNITMHVAVTLRALTEPTNP